MNVNIDVKANVGDHVYYLKPIRRTTCSVCAGAGKIFLGNAFKVDLVSNPIDKVVESVSSQLAQNISKFANGNAKEYICPECKGKGTVKITGQEKYEIGEANIIGIEIKKTDTCNKVLYRTVDTKTRCIKTLTDKTLFTESERDVIAKLCDFMNLERKTCDLVDIKIPYCFATTIPCNEKLMRRLDEWRKARKFDTEIYVDENLNLFDGYTSYLVYRMLGQTEVPVVI